VPFDNAKILSSFSAVIWHVLQNMHKFLSDAEADNN